MSTLMSVNEHIAKSLFLLDVDVCVVDLHLPLLIYSIGYRINNMKFSAALFLAGATAAGAFAPAPAFSRTSTLLHVAVGDKAPSVNLHQGFPPDMVNFADYAKGKKMILVGLPGAL
jgi:hypothetical protein